MRINANVEYTLDELNKFFVNLGYKDRLDKAFLAKTLIPMKRQAMEIDT